VGEGGNRAGQGIGAESDPHLGFGDSERRRGGNGPLKGVRESRLECEAGSGDVGQGEGNPGTGSGEKSRARGFDLREDLAFRAALRGGDGRQGDGDGVVGESALIRGSAIVTSR
jgi:hypothetical protein